MNAGRVVRWGTVYGMLTLIAGGATGCSGDLLQEPDTGIGTVVDLVSVSGNGQSGEPGTTLPQPIRARLVLHSLEPTEGLWVQWVVVEGGGSVSPEHSFADESGIVETTWTLGPGPGRQKIEARFREVAEDFQAQTVD